MKNHISLFLALLMLTKLFAFDGQLLNLVADSEDLVVVTHSCKMKNLLAATPVAEDLEESPAGLQMEYDSFCNSFFHFEVVDPFTTFVITPFHEFSSPVLRLHAVERPITSPPPKAAV